MKYWRGYLVAGIMFLAAWALNQFAAAHTQLVDMVYPYMTRLFQTSLAQWASSADFCLWQMMLLLGVGAVFASVILMVVLRWNPAQWFGWILAAVAAVNLLYTGIYGMNQYSGSIADDVRLETSEYSLSAMEDAAKYYLEKAAEYSSKVVRDSSGNVKEADFQELSQDAVKGFQVLVYEKQYPIFAGSMLPVKQLGWSGLFSGVTGATVAFTGEAAVNPNVPAVGMPFAMCKEMSRRMSISREADATFAAFLACLANEDAAFIYSGYLQAFRQCYNALGALDTAAGKAAYQRVNAKLSGRVKQDLEAYNDFLGRKGTAANEDAAFLLVNWHIQTVVVPSQEKEEDKVVLFDPLDENDDRLADLINPTE